jgi:hypothetical protein
VVNRIIDFAESGSVRVMIQSACQEELLRQINARLFGPK